MVVLDLFVTTDDAPATSRIDNTSFNHSSHSVKTVPSSLFVANTRASVWTVVPTQSPLADKLPNQPSDDIFRQSQESLLAGASRKRGSSSPLLFLDNIFSRLCQKLSAFYNGLMASLFPHEPELLDVQLTAFFIAQLPSMIFITLKWTPALVPWLMGMRGSQAGDRGAGNGMRRSLSMTMGMSLAFLKTYLNHAKTMTIEECQSRSKAIPFTNALAWIRVHKIMIPARPYRTRAEDMVYECLTDQERDLLGLRKEGRRIYGINCDSDGDNDISTTNCALGQDQSASANNQEDPLRVEWLEYIGPTHPTQDLNENNNYAAVIYFHGGGYYTGSAEEHRLLVGPLVQRLGKNIRILGVNYRLAPQHPFPGALVDGLTAYMWLLEQSVSESFFPGDQSASANINGCFQPNQIILMGDSAGGGLALSMSLMIRDHGSLPQPLSLIGWSPWLDLTHSLPSFKENRHSDCIPYEDFVHPHSPAVDMMFDDMGDWADGTKRRVRQRAQVYCPDSCLRIKYVSPIFETNFKGISNVFILRDSNEFEG
ncbi:hypothetical protein BGZ98_010452 [Dissophora globulifera]|nr:hypothetical protein BGZ98_010452 [Dissophora globulifera]